MVAAMSDFFCKALVLRTVGQASCRAKDDTDRARKSPHEAGKGSPEKGRREKTRATEVKSNVLTDALGVSRSNRIERAPFNSKQWNQRDAAGPPPA
jgi:hypothetical protein